MTRIPAARRPARPSSARAAAGALLAAAGALLGAAGCESLPEAPRHPEMSTAQAAGELDCRIGPGDRLEIIVWQDPNLSGEVPVRPDGRITLPLVKDVAAAGATPAELGRELERRLGEFLQEPVVTVVVTEAAGPQPSHVRVVGEAVTPQSLPYRADMTVLDAVIAAGGLTEFADGNRATLVRTVAGEQRRYRVRLADLLRDGDVDANAALLPGDVVVVPESRF